MPPGRLRAWLQSQARIKPPKKFRLQMQGGLHDFGTDQASRDVGIAAFSTSSTSENLIGIVSEVHPHDLALGNAPATTDSAGFSGLGSPSLAEMSLSVLELCPDIMDLFTGIVRPGYAGKSYDEDDAPKTAEGISPAPIDPKSLVHGHCRHGLPRYMCAYCNAPRAARGVSPRNRRSSGPPHSRTLNVFDLLLPYLQPPIEVLLATPVLFPPGRRPYDYQIQGIRFLAEHRSALLGDEMGLGKTIQTIVALQSLFRRGEVHRVLVLCRRSLVAVWEHELNKWAPELYVLKVRGTREERQWMWQAPACVYVTTYDTARQDVLRPEGSLVPSFDVIVLDEAQEIKNPDAKKTRAVRRIEAEYRWGLSGTPVENKPEDVISIFQYLHPGLFHSTYLYSPTRVKRAIKPFFLRRRIADVLKDLPEKITREVWLDLTPSQRRMYDQVFTESRRILSGPDATRVHALAQFDELRQICNLDTHTGASCKLDYLLDQLDAVVENNQKALVFSTFPNLTLRRIIDDLSSYDPAIFDGSLNDSQRDRLIREFQNDGP
ncbi:MAG: DEAD/DEAH box helicase family protein, partial [Chloroflexi bacterium]|nr:DEAD/DEAH box helicase family protein [Chloroflexota bacterium]